MKTLKVKLKSCLHQNKPEEKLNFVFSYLPDPEGLTWTASVVINLARILKKKNSFSKTQILHLWLQNGKNLMPENKLIFRFRLRSTAASCCAYLGS